MLTRSFYLKYHSSDCSIARCPLFKNKTKQTTTASWSLRADEVDEGQEGDWAHSPAAPRSKTQGRDTPCPLQAEGVHRASRLLSLNRRPALSSAPRHCPLWGGLRLSVTAEGCAVPWKMPPPPTSPSRELGRRMRKSPAHTQPPIVIPSLPNKGA